MKRIISLMLILLLALSVAACTDNSSKEVSNNDSQTEQEAINNEEKEEAPDIDAEEERSDETEKTEEDKKENEKEEQEPVIKPEQTPAVKPETKPEQTPQEKPEVKPETLPEDNSSKTVGNTLLSEFKSLADSGSALSVAEKLAASSTISALSTAAMSVEPGYLNGFDNAEITGFKEGAMFAPMIGTIPFVGYVFTLEDGADASAFISTLKSSANLRWNICTSADEMVAGSSGNKVFFVMCPASIEE